MRYNDEFRLYREIVKYSNYIRRYVLGTITNVHRDLRIHLMDEVYALERYLI